MVLPWTASDEAIHHNTSSSNQLYGGGTNNGNYGAGVNPPYFDHDGSQVRHYPGSFSGEYDVGASDSAFHTSIALSTDSTFGFDGNFEPSAEMNMTSYGQSW